MSSAGRKRRRQKPESATMAALDLPNIPGVPMDVIPPFVHAIRVATKFYAKCHGRPYYGDDAKLLKSEGEQEKKLAAGIDSAENPPVVNSLLERIDAATETTTTSPEMQEWQERKERMQDATGRWLESVKRVAKSSQRREEESAASLGNDNSPAPNSDSNGKDSTRISVPYACFLYIWDLQQTHERVAVRRAGLHLSALLLQRSKDCRFHLEQEDNLDQWLKATLLEYRPAKSKDDLPLLQREADYCLNSLVDKGYASLYPKIQVASQRLRQQCPHLEASKQNEQTQQSDCNTATVFSSMVDWRRIRDIALEYGSKEIAQVERWINRSYQCLEILVPRMGSDEATSPSNTTYDESEKPNLEQATNQSCVGSDSADDEEDDIDWENGGEDNDFDDGTANIVLPDFEHFSAVERTLAAMESAGNLQGGEIEIDLRDNRRGSENENIDSPVDDMAKKERTAALTKFQKCVSLLARRHVPRLTIWLEGLTNADNLTVTEASSALVSMPSAVVARRKQIVHCLTDLKQRVSKVLLSATKLDVHSGEEETKSMSAEDHATPTLRLSSSAAGNRGRENLASAVQRQRKPKPKSARSNRIQIKFRSR